MERFLSAYITPLISDEDQDEKYRLLAFLLGTEPARALQLLQDGTLLETAGVTAFPPIRVLASGLRGTYEKAQVLQEEIDSFVAWAGKSSVENVGIPIRCGILQASGRSQELAVMIQRHTLPSSYTGVADEASLTALKDNFGWMLELGDCLRDGTFDDWSVAKFMAEHSGPRADDASPLELDPLMWSKGCKPVFDQAGRVGGVLVRYPVTPQTVAHLRAQNKTRVDIGVLDGVMLQTVTPGFDCAMLPSETGSGDARIDAGWQPCMFMTHLLTPDRLLAVRQAARSLNAHDRGVALSGPHGIGKSATLRLLASVVSIGAGGDVAFFPDAATVLPSAGDATSNSDTSALDDSAWEETMVGAFQACLSLSCGAALSWPDVSRALMQVGKPATALRGTKELFCGIRGHFGSPMALVRTDSLSALVMDEVNRLEKRVHVDHFDPTWFSNKTASVEGFWYSATAWFQPGQYLFAYSPDSKVHRRKLPFFAEDHHPFFEMRQVPPDTALALLKGTAGYECAGRGVSVKEGSKVQSCFKSPEDLCLQVPEKRREKMKDAAYSRTLEGYVKLVAGDTHSIHWLLQDAPDAVFEDADAFQAHAQSVLVGRIEEMKSQCVAYWEDKEADLEAMLADPAKDFSLHKRCNVFASLASSSIVQRVHHRDPRLPTLRTARLASPVALVALVKALGELLQTSKVTDPAVHEAVADFLEAATLLPGSDEFVKHTRALLLLGLLGAGMTPLGSASPRHAPPLHALGSQDLSTVPLNAWALGNDDMLRAAGEGKGGGKVLDLGALRKWRQMRPGERCVVRTPRSFPALDFIIVSRAADADGDSGESGSDVGKPHRFSVVFVEARRSSMARHGQGKAAVPKNLLAQLRLPEDSDVSEHCIDVLAFMINRSCASPGLAGSKLQVDQAKEGVEGQHTIANCILHGMDMPVRLVCQAQAETGDDAVQSEPEESAGRVRFTIKQQTLQELQKAGHDERTMKQLMAGVGSGPGPEVTLDHVHFDVHYVHFSSSAAPHLFDTDLVDFAGWWGLFKDAYLPVERRGLRK